MNTIIRYKRLFILTAGFAVAFWIAYILRSVIFPFALGLVLAYLLLPLISWIEQKLPEKKRVLPNRVWAIIMVFVLSAGIIGSFSFYLGTTIINSVAEIVKNAPGYTIDALQYTFSASIRELFPEQLQQQVEVYLNDIGNTLGLTVQNVIDKGLALLPTTISITMGIFSLPFFLFYLLKDWEKLSHGFDKWLPAWAAMHSRNILLVIGIVLGRYIRAQAMLGLIVGSLIFTGLSILRVPYAPLLALLAGITEVVPIIGPWIGGITAVVIVLGTVPDQAIWVIVLFLSVQLVENLFLVPRIQGGRLNIHPAIAMVLLVMATYFAGFWGLLLILPLTATVIAIYEYVQKEIQLAEKIEKEIDDYPEIESL